MGVWMATTTQAGHHSGRSDSCACVYCGDVMVCDGGICDCVAVMDDVRPVLVVYVCIMVALWRGGTNYT